MKKLPMVIVAILSLFLLTGTAVADKKDGRITGLYDNVANLQGQIDDLQDQINNMPEGPPGPPGADGLDLLYELCELYQLTGNQYPLKCWNCGNGTVEPMEECDDGNTDNGDGCSADCTIETGRFTDMGDGTVRDNDTGLIWTKSANPVGYDDSWQWAMDRVALISSGECGLTDGSTDGDWRLPTKDELQGIGTNPPITWSSGIPSVAWTTPGAPFTDVQISGFWTSTEYDSNSVWIVYMGVGHTDTYIKEGGNGCNIWPVRNAN
jgi:cysteine-rich repeat protein